RAARRAAHVAPDRGAGARADPRGETGGARARARAGRTAMTRAWLACAVLAACGGHAHDHEPAEEPAAEAFTRWTKRHEFFVEYPPLVAGRASAFAVHVT